MDSDVDKINSELNGWKGGKACFLSYIISHSQLEVEITHTNRRRRNLHLRLSHCTEIYFSGPVRWDNVDLSIKALEPTRLDPGDTKYEVSDANSGFRVLCTHVKLEKDVHPVY